MDFGNDEFGCPDCGYCDCRCDESHAEEPEEEDYELQGYEGAYRIVERFHGRTVHTAATMPDLRQQLQESGYWPSVWIISDHGNAHLVTDWK